jgi:hypothetical protein
MALEEVRFRLRNEHEGVVRKLCSRQFLCVDHQLERFYPVTHEGSDTRALPTRSRPHMALPRHFAAVGKRSEQADMPRAPGRFDEN